MRVGFVVCGLPFGGFFGEAGGESGGWLSFREGVVFGRRDF